jgi:hypothetical protein
LKFLTVREKAAIRNLLPGYDLFYLAGYHQIRERNIISGSVRYFSHGTVINPAGPVARDEFHPFELATDAGYTRRLTDQLSAGIVLRYIHSDLNGWLLTPGVEATKPGISVAGDLGLYYQKEIRLGQKDALWAILRLVWEPGSDS